MEHPASYRIKLRDGRALEYAEYGDPEGEPLLYFHGFLGSIHEVGFADKAAKKCHVRLIAWNRSGVGGSTFVDCRRMEDAICGVEQLLDHCGVRHCQMIGISGGAAFALECARILPERTDTIWIISALGPLKSLKILSILHPFLRTLLLIHQRFPAVGKFFFLMLRKIFLFCPKFFVKSVIKLGKSDREFLQKTKSVPHLFMENLRAIFIEGQGEEFLLQELKLYSRWQLSSFPREHSVEVWQGKEDPIVPPTMAETFLRSIPSARLTMKPGGHFLLVKHLPEIMATMRRRLVAA